MSNELGVGIIGTGWVSNEHIRAYRQNPYTEVRGIAGSERSRAAAKIREWNLDHCRAYADVHEMLKDDAIKIVSICTPHHLHKEQGVDCAEAGRHILMEKPMAVDLEGVRALDAAVRKAVDTHRARDRELYRRAHERFDCPPRIQRLPGRSRGSA